MKGMGKYDEEFISGEILVSDNQGDEIRRKMSVIKGLGDCFGE